MSTLFDLLSQDVINYCIRPYLADDYYARIALNSLLLPGDKRYTPLRIDAVKQFEMTLNLVKMEKLVNVATYSHNNFEKAKGILEVFNFLLKNPFIIKHEQKMWNVVFKQATTFADENSPQYTLLEGSVKEELIDKARLLLILISKTPILKTITTSKTNETWSAVDGAGIYSIVDNASALAALEVARRSKPHWRVFYRGYDDDDGEEEYGYFDARDKWVFLKDEYEWSQEEEPHVSRQGTVLEEDGWEKVVSRKR